MTAPYPSFDQEPPCAADPELFFPESADAHWKIPHAQALCAACPGRRGCLAYALTHDVTGVWGGTSYPQRQNLRKQHNIKAAVVVVTDQQLHRDTVRSLLRQGKTREEIAAATRSTHDAVDRLICRHNLHRESA